MKLPCAVVRDLLPLYAENMTEPETRKLIDAHLADCPECRKKLSETKAAAPVPVDAAKPLLNLKKQINQRRRRAALIAGLLVFILIFTWNYHANSLKPLAWQDGLIEVTGVETVGLGDRPGRSLHIAAGQEGQPKPGEEALVLKMSGMITAAQTETVTEDDGTVTVLLQGFGRRSSFEQPAPLSEGEMVFYPVPDRLIYGFESPQALLWGEPLNGGVEVLPRLALAFYAILAVALCLVAGLLWFIFRKKPWSAILRQVFFAPVSYLAAHALILGRRTATFSLLRDFGGVLLLAAALYALLTLLWPVWLQHKKERSPKSAGDIR